MLLEPVTSQSVKHVQLVDTDTEPNSRKIVLFILVRRINQCGPLTVTEGTASNKTSRKRASEEDKQQPICRA